MKLIVLLFLVSCGDITVGVGGSDMAGGDLISEPGSNSNPSQPLPPGYNERGCQWDNPGCGNPTPGTRLTPNTTPYPERP